PFRHFRRTPTSVGGRGIATFPYPLPALWEDAYFNRRSRDSSLCRARLVRAPQIVSLHFFYDGTNKLALPNKGCLRHRAMHGDSIIHVRQPLPVLRDDGEGANGVAIHQRIR
ncbi:unnamed protein product, partial [Ectocarpus sp. 12 AP-2014]